MILNENKKMIQIHFKHLSGSREGNDDYYHLDANQPITIGRNPHHTLMYDPVQDDVVSGNHAQIKFVNHEVILEDLNSRNGTYVNGSLIETEVVLTGGEEIQFAPEGPSAIIQIKKTSQKIPPPPVKKGVGKETAARIADAAIEKHIAKAEEQIRDEVTAQIVMERQFTVQRILKMGVVLAIFILLIVLILFFLNQLTLNKSRQDPRNGSEETSSRLNENYHSPFAFCDNIILSTKTNKIILGKHGTSSDQKWCDTSSTTNKS